MKDNIQGNLDVDLGAVNTISHPHTHMLRYQFHWFDFSFRNHLTVDHLSRGHVDGAQSDIYICRYRSVESVGLCSPLLV